MPVKTISREKVIWAFSIVLKHLKWYILTSEQLSQAEKEDITSSLVSVHRVLQKAEKAERKVILAPQDKFDKWMDEYNQRQIESGKRPREKRVIVRELIDAMLGK